MFLFWCLVHGAIVWKAAVFLVAATGFALARRCAVRSAAGLVAWAVVAGALGVAFFFATGEVLRRRFEANAPQGPSGMALVALAAVTPNGRDAALGWSGLWVSTEETRKAGPAWAALYLENGRCEDAIRLLLSVEQRDEAVAAARRCVASVGARMTCAREEALWMTLEEWDLAAGASKGAGCRGRLADEHEAFLRYSAGDFAAAARLLGREPLTLASHRPMHMRAELLAGSLAAAASDAREIAGMNRDDTPGLKRAQRCTAEAIAARSGDAVALSRLRDAARSEGDGACTLLAIDLLEGSERLQAITVARRRTQSPVLSWWLDLLEAEADGRALNHVATERWDDLVDRPCLVLGASLPPLELQLAEDLATEASPPDPVRVIRARVSATSAVLALTAGDFDAARSFARTHVEDVDALIAAGWAEGARAETVAGRAQALVSVAERAAAEPLRARMALWPVLESVTAAPEHNRDRVDWVRWDGDPNAGLVCLVRSPGDSGAWDLRALLDKQHERSPDDAWAGASTLRFSELWRLGSQARVSDLDINQVLRSHKLGASAAQIAQLVAFDDAGFQWRKVLGLGGPSNAERAGVESLYRALLRRDIAVPIAVWELGGAVHEAP